MSCTLSKDGIMKLYHFSYIKYFEKSRMQAPICKGFLQYTFFCISKTATRSSEIILKPLYPGRVLYQLNLLKDLTKCTLSRSLTLKLNFENFYWKKVNTKKKVCLYMYLPFNAFSIQLVRNIFTLIFF